MDLEGKNAATTPSVREIDAEPKGEANGDSGKGLPSAGPDSLDMQPDNGNYQSSAGPESLDAQPGNGNLRPSNPKSSLPGREPPQPANQPNQISILRLKAAEPLSPEIEAARKAARAERRNPAHESDRDGGSRLPGRKDLRRQL